MKHSWNNTMDDLANYDRSNWWRFFGGEEMLAQTEWALKFKPKVHYRPPPVSCSQVEWQQRYVETGGEWRIVHQPICLNP
ncbi:MAG: hypothetical protein OXR68_06270 [Alphaproteobacteria bacterium]|nr:hypothetical protein [Alphaproteobacteria bacterium]MDD9920211.1 hypothetical protein [Alphaproteobacteria bacterium]